MYESNIIADRIKIYAKQNKIQIKKMLEECGLSKNSLSSMLSGSTPKSENLAKIADYLDCSVDYLLGRTDIAERQHLTSAEALVTVNSKENILLLNFRNMNTAGQDYILQTIDMAKDKYKKCDSVSDRESIG